MAKKMESAVKTPDICVRAPNCPFRRDRVRDPKPGTRPGKNDLKVRRDRVRRVSKR